MTFPLAFIGLWPSYRSLRLAWKGFFGLNDALQMEKDQLDKEVRSMGEKVTYEHYTVP